MAKINRKYIDKHWLVFLFRGALAATFGCFALFTRMASLENVIAIISVFLLLMGIIDAVGALYCSTKKHGWFNAVVDAAIDVAAALTLLFSVDNLANVVIVISVYTIASGLIDIFHGFLSTVDPTDRFIRVFAGVAGCVIGLVILNAGNFEISTFIRFFGTYMMIVGATSLIYGVHNRSQELEDKVARSQSAKKKTAKKHTRKK
jgi:uncharacterized membrane protein HdeD (DUF308 family)